MPDTTSEELDGILAAAARAAGPLATSSPEARGKWLRACADALDREKDTLVPLAAQETSLPPERLAGEISRSTAQLRMFASEFEDGTLLELVIDHADSSTTPPRPDLRRMLVPLGPVLVFAASNFPFAFSVCGGDVASALGAGCPVVVKVHPGHPRTSQATARLMHEALAAAGAPPGTLSTVEGFSVGVDALKDPRVRAASFTGSLGAGLALHRIANEREDPIPFYGELGSLNPVFVLPGAVDERGAEVASDYVASLAQGVGQFCTSPGMIFLPAGHGLDDALTAAAAKIAPSRMLNDHIRHGYEEGAARVRAVTGVELLHEGTMVGDGAVSPTLLRTGLADLAANWDALTEECFGPLSIVVEYSAAADLPTVAQGLGGNLTATVHASDSEPDRETAAKLLPVLAARVGRVVWNSWPTGVAVTWAMEHGGPFPATVGTNSTSVGTTAARRFQRPVCYQGTPEELLPQELRDGTRSLVRRIDGTIACG